MRIAITGATGLVGSALVERLRSRGDEVLRIVRSSPAGSDVVWHPSAGELDAQALQGVDAVVHLAGESIADGRWNAAKKARIRDSRLQGTELLAKALAQLDPPPQCLVSASAIGYYGDRDDEVCTEETAAGQGFLADVCQAWEAAAQPARDAGIRVVHPRIGVVLSTAGGALQKMLLPFRLGVGGRIGDGTQYFSWITRDDLVALLVEAIDNQQLRGPVNAVAPQPVTNAQFTRTLGNVLKRPTILPLPAFAAKLVLGEMADALLLASTRVVPEKLASAGFQFSHPELRGALASLLA